MSSGLISRTSSKKRWEQSHIDKGLCIKCCRKVEDGKLKCPYHLNLDKIYRQRKNI